MKSSARFGGGGLYASRSDISGEILQKISTSLYFKHNREKLMSFSLNSKDSDMFLTIYLLPVSP